MSKGSEEKLTYADWGYIPATDLTQDEIDRVKKMADRLNSAESEEEAKYKFKNHLFPDKQTGK